MGFKRPTEISLFSYFLEGVMKYHVEVLNYSLKDILEGMIQVDRLEQW